MSDDLSLNEDIQPWYKQFWPWFIIALPAAVVVAGISTVIFAFKHADVVVKDNHYKEGLAINSQVADVDQARTLKLSADITVDAQQLKLALKAGGHPLPAQDFDLLLQLNHPVDDKQDTELTLKHVGDGNFEGELPAIKTGRWYLDISPAIDNPTWRIKKETQFPHPKLHIIAE